MRSQSRLIQRRRPERLDRGLEDRRIMETQNLLLDEYISLSSAQPQQRPHPMTPRASTCVLTTALQELAARNITGECCNK